VKSNPRPLSPRRGEGRGEGSRTAILLCGFVVAACNPELVIGVERQVAVNAAVVDPASGELLQAGTRQGDLWYARTRGDGTVVREQKVDFAGGDDAVHAAVVMPGGGWAIAGAVTRGDGRPAAWVRVLDGSDAEVWTKTYEKNGGWDARGLAVDPEGTLVVVGLEGEHGFIARLDETGAARWQYSTATDLQMMIRNLRIYSVATIGDSSQRVVTAGERTFDGGVLPELSQWNMMGDFYDSLRLDAAPGTSRGLVLDVALATVCTQAGDDIVVRRTAWTKMTPQTLQSVVLHVDGARLELGGCAVASDLDLLVGATAVFPDGRRVARAAKVERAASSVRWERDVSAPAKVTVAGVAADGEGRGWLFGHTDEPLRRWTAEIP